ncbi:EF hand family protein [Trichomonas vaginalis G3]|uniref:EF hand family protein n=1 Tax=Trichomonas vaginalis (strain ATCC PRA-98 / G3) TaxID=412133 RepID=A2D747_TRIV3|nr:calcium ion binding [Trichomonas vaginalis G3]EAY23564.1 EF hand family protein [Trichomonas vaginalis G3]KAI5490062.1 calcium ion binding [Trichomonas vaginalis G3]|eukprot:XP_001276812.1 EF hand family protein [Trichomonas vaginalis G3]
MSKKVAVRSTGRREHRENQVQLNEEQRLEIKSAFEVFDADKNGKIDKQELKICVKAMGFDVSKEELNDYIQERGDPEREMIDYPAFYDFIGLKMQKRNNTEEIKRSYKLFKDGASGNITINDLRKIAKEMGTGLTEDDLQIMIKEFDQDGDGEINIAEFMAIMDPSLAN